MAKRILKVKFGSDKKHVFVYEDIKDKDNGIIDEFDFKSKDKALPEFYTALQAMAEHACRICEFPRSYDKGVTVTGVSFSYTEVEATGEEVMGAVITFQKVLDNSNSPLCINTPHKPSKFYDGKPEGESPQDPALLLSTACVEALETLQAEAIRYIDGERDQAELKFENSSDSSNLSDSKEKAAHPAGENISDAFRPTNTSRKKSKNGTGLTKGVEKIAKDFRKNMQKHADDDNVKITISSGDNVAEFNPQHHP